MSEDDEIAMLHAMQQGQTQDGLAWKAGADEMVEGDEAEKTEQTSEQPVKEEKLDSDDQHVLRATSAATSDDGGYNPNASTIITSQGGGSGDNTPSRNPAAAKKKQVGAFVDDSDDDEEEDNAMPKPAASTLQPPAAARSVSKSPLHLETIQESQRNSPSAAVDSPSVAIATDRVVQESNRASEAPAASTSNAPAQETTNLPKARLPHDRVGILEDRIAEDPRGDIAAWLDLISEHQKRNKLDDARSVFERFFQVFPMAADIWVAYIEMELSNDNFQGAEVLFAKSLLTVPNVGLWSTYLNYVRRRNDLTNDATGANRTTIAQAYDFVLATIGMDREAGRIWQEYIQFIRQGPGAVGGTTWQDQQKMDQLRKAYQRAVCVPMANVNDLWKEYDQFEMSLNKITGRKFLQEKSPSYMTARSANTALGNITRGLNRTNLPRLPPAPGFEGDKDYLKQVDLWKQWISWEKEDPLVLKDEDPELLKKRILYAYKQSIMALWFWPEMWVEAAEWAFANGMEKEGNDFMSQGINANPESCLLAFKQADRLEAVLPQEEGEEGIASRGAAVRAPYQKNLDALYELLKKLKARETDEIAKIQNGPLPPALFPTSDEDDEDNEDRRRQAARDKLIDALKQGHAVQQRQIQRTLSFAWIALMRAMRRVQGKGKVGAPIGGSRQILNDARLKGKITSDVYVASALIEHNVYKDPAGTKIFERGAKLFPEDEVFILEYLKHLLSIGDTTNARAVFETSVTRLASKPETLPKSKPLYTFFHKYESDYGELSQIARLEQRMADLFLDDPKLQRFASRYSMDGFDPTTVRPIISPASQMRPKLGGAQQQEPRVMQSIEREDRLAPLPQRSVSPRPQYRETSARPTYQQRERSRSPRPTYGHLQNHGTGNSPKRTHAQMGGDVDEDGRSIPYSRSDGPSVPPTFSAYTTGGPDPHYDHTEAGRPRKLQRGESPLKGAAGRRLVQQKVALGGQAIGRTEVYRGDERKEVVIPRDITFLLSIIPGADTYAPAPVFGAEEMVGLLRRTEIPAFREWKTERDRTLVGQGGRW